MFCPQCGTQLPDGARFCAKCGADLTTASQEDAIAKSDTSTASEPTPKSHTTRNIAVAVASVLVVAAIGVGTYLYLTTPTGTPIDEEHFPDKGFCSFVATQLDTDGNGLLSAQEVEQVTVVDLSGETGISDVTGVATFTDLQSFTLGDNKVEQVDLSQNTQVAQVNIGSGNAGSVILPSDFDLQSGLSGSVTNEIQSGDVVIQADEWTNDNNGKFGPMQRYNGVLYAGKYTNSNRQIQVTGAKEFFGSASYFHLAEGKAYWVDNNTDLGPAPGVLHSANIDGSDIKDLAQDVENAPMYYVDSYIFFRVSNLGKTPSTVLSYLNTKTDESGTLPSEVNSLVGVCDSRLVVSYKTPAQEKMPAETLAFFDPATKELSTIPSSEVDVVGLEVAASNAGVLAAASSASLGETLGASFFSPNGSPLWTGRPFSEGNRTDSVKTAFSMDDTSYYLVYESDPLKHDFTLETVDLSTNGHTRKSFNILELSESDQADSAFSYANILCKDGNSLIISFTKMRNSSDLISSICLYRVSLEDGKAELLQGA